jgi:hypothetical protein
MKKVFLFLILINCIAYSQTTKNELLNEIESYKKSQLLSFQFDTNFKELFDAISIMGNQNFGSPVRESETRGYVEFKKESDDKRENLTIEIRGENKPYRLSISYKIETKPTLYKTEGTFGKPDYKIITEKGNWEEKQIKSEELNVSINLKIFKILYKEFLLPNELKDKIQNFNLSQKRDRKKILQGVDFEL